MLDRNYAGFYSSKRKMMTNTLEGGGRVWWEGKEESECWDRDVGRGWVVVGLRGERGGEEGVCGWVS